MAYQINFASEAELNAFLGAWRRDGFAVKTPQGMVPLKLQSDGSLALGRYPAGKTTVSGTSVTVEPNGMLKREVELATSGAQRRFDALEPRERMSFAGKIGSFASALQSVLAGVKVIGLVTESVSNGKYFGGYHDRLVNDGISEFLRSGAPHTPDGLMVFAVLSGYFLVYEDMARRLFASDMMA